LSSNVISWSSHYSNIPDHSEHQDGNVKWMVISFFSWLACRSLDHSRFINL